MLQCKKICLCIIVFYFALQTFLFGDNSKTNIQIFLTSNLQGWFDSKDLLPKKGASGLYYLYEDILEAKRASTHNLLLDSGDFFYGSARSFYALGAPENVFLKYFLKLPYDVITLGNRDLEKPEQLEQILQSRIAISSNLASAFTKPYEIFQVANKKIFIASLSYVEDSFQKEGWRKKNWEQAIIQIKKTIQKENPDLVIGIFHLSLFYSRNSYTPSVEQILLKFPIWDLIIAGQSFRSLPYRNDPTTRIAGVPIVRAAGEGKSWLEVQVNFQKGQKKFSFLQHYPKRKNSNNLSKDFLAYLNQSTNWVYKKRKARKKECLQNSLHLALQEKWTLHSKLRLSPFSLKTGEAIQRRHLFYWLPYFNQKAVAFFSAHDFQRIKQKDFQKEYFFVKSEEIPKTKNFFQKYQKKYPVALNNYELRKNSFVVNQLLQKPEEISYQTEYIHSMWFDYLKNNSPKKGCGMFQKNG
jgi:hypothetical protein